MNNEEIFIFTVDDFPYEAQKFSCYKRHSFPQETEIIKVSRIGGAVRLTFMKKGSFERIDSTTTFFPFVLPREKKPIKKKDSRQEVLF